MASESSSENDDELWEDTSEASSSEDENAGKDNSKNKVDENSTEEKKESFAKMMHADDVSSDDSNWIDINVDVVDVHASPTKVRRSPGKARAARLDKVLRLEGAAGARLDVRRVRLDERVLRGSQRSGSESESGSGSGSDYYSDSESSDEMFAIPQLFGSSGDKKKKKRQKRRKKKQEPMLRLGNVETDGNIEKPGVQWRLLKPAELKKGFVTAASEPHTMGFAHGLVTVNRPSLVGVVDPVEVSHIAMEEDPDVELKFISDIMEDTEHATTRRRRSRRLNRRREVVQSRPAKNLPPDRTTFRSPKGRRFCFNKL